MPPKATKTKANAKLKVAARTKAARNTAGPSTEDDWVLQTAATHPPDNVELTPAHIFFHENIRPNHPVWKSEEAIREQEKTLGGPLQPWWHAQSSALPNEAGKVGFVEVYGEEVQAAGVRIMGSRGPLCFKDGKTHHCHRDKVLAAFYYKHPNIRCKNIGDGLITTIVDRWEEGKFLSCSVCYSDTHLTNCTVRGKMVPGQKSELGSEGEKENEETNVNDVMESGNTSDLTPLPQEKRKKGKEVAKDHSSTNKTVKTPVHNTRASNQAGGSKPPRSTPTWKTQQEVEKRRTPRGDTPLPLRNSEGFFVEGESELTDAEDDETIDESQERAANTGQGKAQHESLSSENSSQPLFASFPSITMSPSKSQSHSQEDRQVNLQGNNEGNSQGNSQESSQGKSREVASTLLSLSHSVPPPPQTLPAAIQPSPFPPAAFLQPNPALPAPQSTTNQPPVPLSTPSQATHSSPMVTPTPSRTSMNLPSVRQQQNVPLFHSTAQIASDNAVKSPSTVSAGLKRKANEPDQSPVKVPRLEAGNWGIKGMQSPAKHSQEVATAPVVRKNPQQVAQGLVSLAGPSSQPGSSSHAIGPSQRTSRVDPEAWLKKINMNKGKSSTSDARPTVDTAPLASSVVVPANKLPQSKQPGASSSQPGSSFSQPAPTVNLPATPTRSSSPSLGPLYEKPFAPSLTTPQGKTPFILRPPTNLDEVATCFDLVNHFHETEAVHENAFAQTAMSDISRMFQYFQQSTSIHRRRLTQGVTTATQGVLALQDRYNAAIASEDGLRSELATVKQHLISMEELYTSQVKINENREKAIEDIKNDLGAQIAWQNAQISSLSGQVSVLSDRWSAAVKDKEDMVKEVTEKDEKFRTLEFKLENTSENLLEAAGVVQQAIEDKNQLVKERDEIHKKHEKCEETIRGLSEELGKAQIERMETQARYRDQSILAAAYIQELARMRAEAGLPDVVAELGEEGKVEFTEVTEVRSTSPNDQEGGEYQDTQRIKIEPVGSQEQRERSSAPDKGVEENIESRECEMTSVGEAVTRIEEGPEAVSIEEAGEAVEYMLLVGPYINSEMQHEMWLSEIVLRMEKRLIAFARHTHYVSVQVGVSPWSNLNFATLPMHTGLK
ncbi:hypothetical protein TREMEDRAFT_65684 [Tremella mesenterica DSM 1558]|uniref:uncharacterized protein n=1 Tax=Tremella mesenterica (strain ATCC 24925 / CBS 8224 / DSM 1558 / NBRC 9311 / NRRL Y-6157 / RJB 2259-6 / UBC 559-6) TaxID=578456 RepID=UPI00032D5814|nr:uncharacterized protein TREMEDRAFT_65684 [Tremella mesenterica DSM 1558]EIW66397.1 hypothetical protein TREMEDRAFT_65684 [Tremella mesenterica DSM 1558]